jgi:indolepyruvate ferredoxin oxidoreductase
VTGVADGTTNVQVSADRLSLGRLPVASITGPDGRPFTHTVTAVMLQPALSELERSREGIRREMAIRYAGASQLNQIQQFAADGTARLGIVAAGKTYLDLRHALATLGLDDAELGRRPLQLGRGHDRRPGTCRWHAR